MTGFVVILVFTPFSRLPVSRALPGVRISARLPVFTETGEPYRAQSFLAGEPGLLAIAGCGDATTRIKNGDRVPGNGLPVQHFIR